MAFPTINIATPVGTDKPRVLDDEIRQLKSDVIDCMQMLSNFPAINMPAGKTSVWTTANRPTGTELVNGVTGYNTTLGYEEYYDLSTTTWVAKNAYTANNLVTAGQSALISLIYPVGSIYLSVNATSPATLFGGTWKQLQDTFLLAAGNNYTAGTTGGEASHVLTVSELPSHTHNIVLHGDSGGSNGISYNDGITKSFTYTSTPTGDGYAHNNMPPYVAVYMWKRTA